MFDSKVKLKIAMSEWKKIEKDFKNSGDNAIVRKLIETYGEHKKLKSDLSELRRKISSQSELKKELDSVYADLRKAKLEKNKALKRYEDLKERNRGLREECDELRENPIIKEKIVCRRNEKAVDDLTRKRDKLEDQIRKLKEELEDMERKNVLLKETLEEKKRIIRLFNTGN